jgi:LysR substrate binding domain
VAREPLVVAVHPTHPLAGRGQLRLRALREEPMVTLTRASKLRSTLETACQAAGFDPRIVAETSDLGVMVELAAEQLGVAVLPASGLAGAAALVQLRLTQPKLDRRLLLVWRPAASPPAARAFLALARRHLTHRRATPDQPGHSPRRLVTQYTVVLMTADRAREQQPRQHGPDHLGVGDPGESAVERLPIGRWAAVPVAVAHDRQGYWYAPGSATSFAPSRLRQSVRVGGLPCL